MERLIDTHRNEIAAYCSAHGINVDKLYKQPRCSNAEFAVFHRVDYATAKANLHDETPAPVLMKLELQNGKLNITTSDDIRSYLA